MVDDRAQSEAGGQPGTGRRVVRALAAAILATTVGLTTVAATASPASASCVSPSTPSVVAESESGFVAQLNGLRQGRGLRTLAVNSALASQSRSWSATMSTQIEPGGSASDPGWLHHARDVGPGDGVEPHQDYVYLIGQSVPNWTRAGENVGVSGLLPWCSEAELRSTVQKATDGLHRAFVNSPGHFQNMIGDYNQVGIGVHLTQDKLWVTVRFAKGDLPAAPALSSAQLTTANAYTDAVYRLFLGRAASSGEQNFWAAKVASGDRGALTRALSVSDEWAGTRVAALYRTVLGREAETSGRLGWVAAISRGMRLEDVAAGIYGSTERFMLSGSTNRGYVSGLYEDILGRKADPGGLADWVGRLDRRQMSRTQVAAGFYGSLESRIDRVQTLYGEILQRSPDPAGQVHWVGKLSTMGDVVLAAHLASSEEFWLRATR